MSFFFLFNNFVKSTEKGGVGTSNKWGTSLIGRNNNAYEGKTGGEFQFYLTDASNPLGKFNVEDHNDNQTNISGYESGKWNHIGLSYSNGTLSVYINGNLAGTPIKTTYQESDSLKDLLNFGTVSVEGKDSTFGATANMGVKDVAFWDEALSAEDMKLLSTGTKPSALVLESSTLDLGLVGIGLLLFRRRRN